MIDGHDSTLDDTAEIVRQLPPVASIARTEQIDELSSTTKRSLGDVQDDLAAQRATIDAQAATIAEQRALIEALQAQVRQVENFATAETARIQARLAEISEQLTRQVDELGQEVDAAARRAEQAASDAQAPVMALDEVKAAQVRLAGEQVRYDLALRAELAELAERLRRSGRS
jgi:predicted  nucleic acid-binding Zn-ribbon protein